MKNKLPLFLAVGSLLTLMGVYLNAVPNRGVNVTVADYQVQICNRNFANFRLTQAPGGVSLVKGRIEVKGLPLPVFAPLTISKTDANLNLVAQVNTTLNLPIMPDVPILPPAEQQKLCPVIQKYADSFLQLNLKDLLITNYQKVSSVFELQRRGNFINLGMKTGYQTAIAQSFQQTQLAQSKMATLVDTQYTAARTRPVYDFLIIYQNGYETEMSDLVSFYNNRKIRTLAVSVEQLPGYNPDAAVPAECSGEFAKECYHTWGDAIQGTSQLAVPSLPGFHGTRPIFQKYNRVSYIPGLIRAYIRALKKQNPLRGVLLVGNPQTIPPFNSNTTRYYYDGVPYNYNTYSAFPSEKLFTDLFYTIPEVPLVLDTTVSNHLIMSGGLWSCRNIQSSAIALRYWCNDNEWRAWGTPPLRDYRQPAHVPQGRILTPKYAFNDAYWSTIGLESIVPVGRIVTQDRFFNGKDPVVGRYINKLKRWYAEMPSMLNNSINSNGGSTSDSWIFSKDDIDQFQTTFGTNSKIYSSEFFVSGWQCAGRCTYKNGPQIMDELSAKNHVAFFLNGHGGHTAIQAPFGNGNVDSAYLSEASSHLNDGLQMRHFEDPTDETIKQVELSHKLVGIIFANSCSPSEYLLNNEGHYLIKAGYPKANERSWAEQWIAMEDAGALNTYLNGNVGWGGSDNSYNVSFMQKIKASWQNCGTVGDALRSLILDGLRGQNSGSGEWQVLNRHFLGSPLNHVARLPLNCMRYPDVTTLVEQVRNN